MQKTRQIPKHHRSIHRKTTQLAKSKRISTNSLKKLSISKKEFPSVTTASPFSTSATTPLPLDLLFKTAIVTGGSRGIGFSTIHHLLQRGCSVIYCSKNEESVLNASSQFSQLLPQFTPKPFKISTQSTQTPLFINTSTKLISSPAQLQFFVGLTCDVASEASIQQLFSNVKLLRTHTIDNSIPFSFSGADILVNCAGITANQLLLRTTETLLNNVLTTNVNGTMLMTKHFLKQLPIFSPTCTPSLDVSQQYYRVVSISSVIGKQGNIGQSAYAASKAAVDGFTRSMAREMATYRSTPITFNSISPGYIQTDMTNDNVTPELLIKLVDKIHLKRIGQPHEVANVIGFLASPHASYINGQTISVDGGM